MGMPALPGDWDTSSTEGGVNKFVVMKSAFKQKEPHLSPLLWLQRHDEPSTRYKDITDHTTGIVGRLSLLSGPSANLRAGSLRKDGQRYRMPWLTRRAEQIGTTIVAPNQTHI